MTNVMEMTHTIPAESTPGPRTAAAPPQVKILIVDDERAVGELLSSALGSKGFNCRNCTNGEEALSSLEQQSFDAVISDFKMPGITGLDLLKSIRPKHPFMAFLMATGVGDVKVGVQAMKDGADDYLLKPFALASVLSSLNRAIERKGLERENEGYQRSLEFMVDQRTRQLRAAMNRIEQAYDSTIEALAAALDLRDSDTAGHSRRVTGYCLEMAGILKCTEKELRIISRGAYLHDIGKIGIPDAILLKPGRLTETERTIMETHARIGYDLVCRIAFLADAAAIVLTHQERFDGTGYPQGLGGDEIPLLARIFGVADTLDAMTSDRPYRRALPYIAAREEITNGSGHQFDPRVVEAFLSIPEARFEAIRAQPFHHVADMYTAGSEYRCLSREAGIQTPASVN